MGDPARALRCSVSVYNPRDFRRIVITSHQTWIASHTKTSSGAKKETSRCVKPPLGELPKPNG